MCASSGSELTERLRHGAICRRQAGCQFCTEVYVGANTLGVRQSAGRLRDQVEETRKLYSKSQWAASADN
jgi:hypothetical protein